MIRNILKNHQVIKNVVSTRFSSTKDTGKGYDKSTVITKIELKNTSDEEKLNRIIIETEKPPRIFTDTEITCETQKSKKLTTDIEPSAKILKDDKKPAVDLSPKIIKHDRKRSDTQEIIKKSDFKTVIASQLQNAREKVSKERSSIMTKNIQEIPTSDVQSTIQKITDIKKPTIATTSIKLESETQPIRISTITKTETEITSTNLKNITETQSDDASTVQNITGIKKSPFEKQSDTSVVQKLTGTKKNITETQSGDTSGIQKITGTKKFITDMESVDTSGIQEKTATKNIVSEAQSDDIAPIQKVIQSKLKAIEAQRNSEKTFDIKVIKPSNSSKEDSQSNYQKPEEIDTKSTSFSVNLLKMAILAGAFIWTKQEGIWGDQQQVERFVDRWLYRFFTTMTGAKRVNMEDGNTSNFYVDNLNEKCITEYNKIVVKIFKNLKRD